jgi:lysozyme
MALDQSYLDAIKGFEGYAPQASWDYKQYSSGYGTRAQPGDADIPPDQIKQVYEQRFQDEIGKAAASVDAFSPNLPPGVRAALTSLTYNAGPGWQQSGLGRAIQSGDMDAAKGIFLQYNKAGGEVNPGLVNRRNAEAAWFGGGMPAAAKPAPASPAAPANGLLAGNIGGLLQAPVLPQAAPQQAAPQPDIFSQMAPPQAQPLMFPQRRQVDLSKLRAQLQAPIFRRG